MSNAFHRVALVVLACAVAASHAGAQNPNDVIRGRVTGPDTTSIYHATVTATSYYGNVTREAQTDKSGHYTIMFLNGEGDYWVTFTAMGFAPKRVEVKRIDQEAILTADAKLSSTIATLDAVNVTTANRLLVNRNANNADVGGGDKSLPINNSLIPPDQAGNLAAMAALIPGIQLIPGMDGAADMFSVLGLGGDQNNTTFNGLGSGISVLPPDAQVSVRMNSQPADVAQGGFSGAQVSIQTRPGSNFSTRGASGRGTGPDLELTDSTGDATGKKSTTVSVGGNALGPLVLDKLFYNSSYNVQRKFTDALTLLNTSDVGLASAGVARDSVTEMLGILHGLHIPASVAGFPTLSVQDGVQLQGNSDFVPSRSGTGHSFTLATLGNYNRVAPIGGGGSVLLNAETRTNETERWLAQVALGHTNYIWFGVFSNTTLGYQISKTQSYPFLSYPQGNVLVTSALPDGSTASRQLFFGGGAQPMNSVQQTVALTNQLSWYSLNNKHTFKLTSNVTREHNTQDSDNNGLGTFSFNSLADLEAGRPSSFTRTLTPTHSATDQITGVLALGDSWKPKGNTNLQIQYGLRVDGNRALNPPNFNQAVLDTFGIRNDVMPSDIYFSPRVGMQWYYGNAPTIAFIPGAARPPRALIHAGAIIVQNLAPVTGLPLSQAVSTTGLPDSRRTMACTGAAVPVPNWDSFLTDPSAIPSQCADGSAGTVFSTTAPSVFAFDKAYKQQRSFRTWADWSGPIVDNRFGFGVQGVYSWNMHQPSSEDINLSRTTRFTLGDEAGRPIFVDPSTISPTSGVIAPQASRIAPTFRSVSLFQSDMNSLARQVTLTLVPVTASQKLSWRLAYVFTDVRQQFNGFSSTVGDPFAKQWGPGLQSGRHQVSLTWSRFPIMDLFFVSAQVGLKSGQRFTPMVLGDVNGDLQGNDRAFVFDPANTADPNVASKMQALLNSGSPAARACLEKQLNSLAARGSCQAPWVSGANLSLQFNPQKIGLPKRLSVVLTFTNPLVGADLLMHGARNMRGWGQEIFPDQSLLIVRGFDPATQRYKYDVNGRFGSTRPQQTTNSVPAYMTLTIGLDIGAPRERQTLTQRIDMGRGRPGTKQNAPAFKSFGTASIPNPMALILQQPDSLKLTRKQADSLATLSLRFALHADSMWTPVAKYLESLPTEYDHGEAYSHYVRAREQTVDYLLKLVPDVKRLLTASQRRKLPPQISNYLDERVLNFLRSSSAGDGARYFIGG